MKRVNRGQIGSTICVLMETNQQKNSNVSFFMLALDQCMSYVITILILHACAQFRNVQFFFFFLDSFDAR